MLALQQLAQSKAAYWKSADTTQTGYHLSAIQSGPNGALSSYLCDVAGTLWFVFERKCLQ